MTGAASIVLKGKVLNESGQCCGRKPLDYKTRHGLQRSRDPHFFCCRCDSEFSPDGSQRASTLYLAAVGGFTPKYPEQEYWHSHERVAA